MLPLMPRVISLSAHICSGFPCEQSSSLCPQQHHWDQLLHYPISGQPCLETQLRPKSALQKKISGRLYSFYTQLFNIISPFKIWSCASFFFINVYLNLTKGKISKERLEAEKRTKPDFKFGNFLIHRPLKIIDNCYIAKYIFCFLRKPFLIVEKNNRRERREILVTSPPVSIVMKTTEANPNVLHYQEQSSLFFFFFSPAINLGVSVPGGFIILLSIQKYLPQLSKCLNLGRKELIILCLISAETNSKKLW